MAGFTGAVSASLAKCPGFKRFGTGPEGFYGIAVVMEDTTSDELVLWYARLQKTERPYSEIRLAN